MSTEELAQVLDISFVSDAHNDHFNRTVSKVLLEKGHCIFVIPESSTGIVQELGFPVERLVVDHIMYVNLSVILISTLNPEFIFPQRHSTIQVNERSRFWAKGYPDEVKIHLSRDLQDRYHIMKEGEKMVIRP